jgi:hypothetical protein
MELLGMNNGWYRKGDDFTVTLISGSLKRIVVIFRVLGYTYPLKEEVSAGLYFNTTQSSLVGTNQPL